jgi:hypothetical protein
MAWKGHAGPVRLTHFIDDVEARGAALGLRIDRARFREEIRRGLLAWPRRPGTIPLASGQA